MPGYDDKLEEVFDQAIALEDSSERDRYVREACGDDRKLLQQVNALFRAP